MSLKSGYGPTVSCGISTQLPGVVVVVAVVVVVDVVVPVVPVVEPVLVVPPEPPLLQPSNVRPLKPPMPPSSVRRENARATRWRRIHWSSDGRVAIDRSMMGCFLIRVRTLERPAATTRPTSALRRLHEDLELRHLLLGEDVLQLAEDLLAVFALPRANLVARRRLAGCSAFALLFARGTLRFT